MKYILDIRDLFFIINHSWIFCFIMRYHFACDHYYHWVLPWWWSVLLFSPLSYLKFGFGERGVLIKCLHMNLNTINSIMSNIFISSELRKKTLKLSIIHLITINKAVFLYFFLSTLPVSIFVSCTNIIYFAIKKPLFK